MSVLAMTMVDEITPAARRGADPDGDRPPDERRADGGAETQDEPKLIGEWDLERKVERAGHGGAIIGPASVGWSRLGSVTAFGRHDRGPDDPRVVPKLGRQDRRADGQARQEFVGVLADAPSQNDEIG